MAGMSLCLAGDSNGPPADRQARRDRAAFLDSPPVLVCNSAGTKIHTSITAITAPSARGVVVSTFGFRNLIYPWAAAAVFLAASPWVFGDETCQSPYMAKIV